MKKLSLIVWVARDKNNELWFFMTQPILEDGYFVCENDNDMYYCERNIFPTVTFENSPHKVELKLIP